MNPQAPRAGHVRLKVMLVMTALVSLFAAANLAGYSGLLQLSGAALSYQAFLFAVLLGTMLALLCGISWFALAPVARLLRQLRQGQEPAPELRSQAQRVALRLPLTMSMITLVLAGIGLGIGVHYDVSGGHLRLDFALGLGCATAAEALLTCTVLYLLLRSLMRPVMAHAQLEQVPAGLRITLRHRVAFALCALCLATAIPASQVGLTQLQLGRQQAQRVRRQWLRQQVRHLARETDPARLRRWLAGAGLAHLEDESRPAGIKRALAAAEPVQPFLRPLSLALLLPLLLLALAIVAGRHLGGTIASDAQLLGRRIREVSDALAAGEQPQPPPRGVGPQLGDLRRVADALNRLMGRLVESSVETFVAIEKRVEADRVKNQFLANVSHDLRSPLNSVLGFAQLLLQSPDERLTEGQRATLTVIMRCGDELLQTINQVLDTARIEAGRMAIHREDCLPAELLSRLRKELRRQRGGAARRLEPQLQPGMKPVWADSLRLQQALLYVALFALDSTSDETVVLQLALEQPGRGGEQPFTPQLAITVHCRNAELPSARQDELFSGFRRRPGRRGLGLELPLARSLVELHDGVLELSRSETGRLRLAARIPQLAPRAVARIRGKNEGPAAASG